MTQTSPSPSQEAACKFCGAKLLVENNELSQGWTKCPVCSKKVALGNRPQRKAWLARLLSLFVPGWGHLYCGKPISALKWFLIYLVGIHLAFLSMIYWDQAPLNVILFLAIATTIMIAPIVSAILTARRLETGFDPRWYSRWYTNFGVIIIPVLLSFIYLPLVFNIEAFAMAAGSMEDTIMVKDRILVDKSAYKNATPQVNDLVAFLFPGDNKTEYIKRCVAVGGDIVELRQKKVFINGKERQEPPAFKHVDPNFDGRRDDFGPYRVPLGTFFMLGDNRDDSYDSRSWGPVPVKNVFGKAFRVFWSPHLNRVGISIK